MYRVYDKREKKFVDYIIENNNGDLYQYQKKWFGKYKVKLVSESRYKVTHDIDVLDNFKDLIFEGDIIKIKDKYGFVGYIPQFVSYVLINPVLNEYYPVSEDTLNKSEIIGNIFSNSDFFDNLSTENKCNVINVKPNTETTAFME